MKIGRILGIIGAILALIGVFLPWVAGHVAATNTDRSLSGIEFPLFIFGMPFLLFVVIGLILVAIPKKGTAIAGLIMGIIAFVIALIPMAILATIIVSWQISGEVASIGYGLYICLVGALLLIIGSAMGIRDASAPKPMPPPMMQPPLQG